MKHRLKVAGIAVMLITLLLLAETALTAAALSSERPKIGLALGGGSAGGFAHIGVLKWLEENHIPVDCIAGTSMGGLMGGIYAMGMSPDQMELLVANLDWDQLFDSEPAFNTLEFRRKEELLNYPTGVNFGLKDKLLVTNGLSVYRVNLLLSRLALPYSNIRNFNELPIPFACVATDLRNSEKVVLSEGALCEALRATMSIPGAFVPVEQNGRLLVDGGLVDNVPADVVKKMGADVVIAVSCNKSNIHRDMRRLDSILVGSMTTIIADNTSRSLPLADIVLHSQPGNLANSNWQAWSRFIAAGYQAAAAQAVELRKLALHDDDWQEYLQKRAVARRLQPLVPEAITVRGISSPGQVKYIEQQLSAFRGCPVDPDRLDAALIEILGSGLYQSFNYEVIDQDRLPTLVITAKKNEYGPPYIMAATQTSFIGEHVSLNLLSRVTTYNVIGADSELAVDLSLGTDPEIRAELYKPVAQSGWFIAPRLAWMRTRNSLFQAGVRVTDFKWTQQSLGIDLGYGISKFSEVRLGYEGGYQDVSKTIGSALPKLNGSFGKIGFKWSYINFSDTLIPHGLGYDFKANWYHEAPGSADRFTTVETSLEWLKPVSSKNTFAAVIAVGATTNGAPSLLQKFTLGGPFRLGTYNLDELRGAHYLLGSFGLLHSLGKPLGLSPVYLSVLVENGGAFDSWSDPDYTSDLAIGLISSTFFGPLYLGTSFGKVDKGRICLLIGRLFK